MAKDSKVRPGIETYPRRGVNTSVDLNEGDAKLIAWGAEFLGCSKAEFHRSAIRAFATNLQQISNKIKS